MLLSISTNTLLTTREGCGKDANWTQEGRRSDAVQTQSRRRETPYGRRAEAPRSMDAGRMRDADGSISYSLAHIILIVFGSFVVSNRYTSVF